MTLTWEPLPWDSEFFGVPIGCVELDGAEPDEIRRVENEARAAGIACLYGSMDPIDSQRTFMVQGLGWRFVEAATMFSLRLDEPPIPKPPGMNFRRGTVADLPQMETVIAKLADWSRFAVDPRFGVEASRRLQFAAIERAAACETDAFALMVGEDDTGVVAFISRVAEPHPTVDTVGTTAQGSGAARYLIQQAREWAGDEVLFGGPIAARNVAALRYVSHCNYRVAWVKYKFHRWLDEGGSK